MKKPRKKEQKKEEGQLILDDAADGASRVDPEHADSIEDFIKIKKLQNEVLNKMLEKIKKTGNKSQNTNQ
jgi:hypothetical protein